MICKFLLPKILGTVSAILFTGCLMDYGAPEDTEPAEVTLDMRFEAMTTFSKSSETRLRCALVEWTSNKGDTLIDSITPDGSRLSPDPVFLFTSPSKAQAFSVRYTLAPGRTWKARVRLYDTQDSVRQADSMTVSGLKAFEDRRVALSLQPRFALYAAQLFLPAEARFVGGKGPENRKFFFTRLRLQDGKTVLRDTSAQAGVGAGFLAADTTCLSKSAGLRFFKPGTFGQSPGIALVHEYATAGARTYTLKAYGYLEGDTLGVTPERLLFQGSHTLNTAQTSETEALALDWQPSERGTALDSNAQDAVRLQVVLGAVKTVVIHVRTSGAVDF
jgi:hypothetical protein